jgi:methylenetetrahydrofolate dehydrogenase (NADP+)/methenyltetrahydrofolate cyclohydrolase
MQKAPKCYWVDESADPIGFRRSSFSLVNLLGLNAIFSPFKEGSLMEIKDYVLKRKDELKKAVLSSPKIPTLAIIVVGNNAASDSYVRGKMKDAAEVGFKAIDAHLPEDTQEADLLALIARYNADPEINGILVQLPVPKQISEKAIHEAVLPSKDVDGFASDSPFECCTPKGICDYLTAEGFSFRGKNAVVIGRSNIVGKPMAKMLLARDCNVTVLHSKTSEEDKRFYLAHADLVVVAIGHLGSIDASYVFKPTCWVVDVGINRGEDGHLHGDCVPGLAVAKQTPVPGGVGLLTRLALLENLLEANR